MEQLNPDKKAIIFVSLRNGEGFTLACHNAGLTPEYVTDYIGRYPSFADECSNYISAGIASLLQKRQQHLEEGNYDAVKKVDELRQKFIDRLTLWQSAGKTIYGTNHENALLLYKRPEEIATAYGMSYEAYLNYLSRKGGNGR
ncbi:hypothetical protein C7N43_39125 [Sphingobacteriales bacterium UPWRP_1]|nr:hypothetical protein C7N43_39125 [Sphingobacteriales bacterium UPWRP_1]